MKFRFAEREAQFILGERGPLKKQDTFSRFQKVSVATHQALSILCNLLFLFVDYNNSCNHYEMLLCFVGVIFQENLIIAERN